MKYNPHDYQKKAIKFAIERSRCALWLDPGLGKTSIVYAVAKILQKRKMVRAALVVAPLNVVHNTWPRERSKWDDFHHFTLKVLHGPKKLQRLKEPADIYLINYEGLEWLAKSLNQLGMVGKKMPFDLFVFDEASKVKNHTSKRFKLLKPWSHGWKRIIELTGTPATNGLEDVWSQLYLLDQGVALGRYWTHFVDTFFNRVGYGGYTLVPKRGSADIIYRAVAPLVMRMSAEDYLELPELSFNNILIELTDELKDRYKTIQDDLVVLLNSGDFRLPSAAAATNKCLQFANGAVYHTDGKTWEEIHTLKLEALDDLIEELGGKPAMIAYNYRHDIERLLEIYSKKPRYRVGHIGAGMAGKIANIAVDKWNKGEYDLLFVQPQSVSHGLNMQEGPASNLIFFSMLWDLEQYMQLIKRLWRQGQEQRVMVHHLLVRGTVDMAAKAALNFKDKQQLRLLDAIKRLNQGETLETEI